MQRRNYAGRVWLIRGPLIFTHTLVLGRGKHHPSRSTPPPPDPPAPCPPTPPRTLQGFPHPHWTFHPLTEECTKREECGRCSGVCERQTWGGALMERRGDVKRRGVSPSFLVAFWELMLWECIEYFKWVTIKGKSTPPIFITVIFSMRLHMSITIHSDEYCVHERWVKQQNPPVFSFLGGGDI